MAALDALALSALQSGRMGLLQDERAQDVSEYSLLLAFLLLISLCLFLQNRRDVSEIWTAANTILGRGARVLSGH
jgi:hypothetical protein